MQRIKIRPCFSAKPLRVIDSDPSHVVVGGTDPQAYIPSLAQPMGQADMVWIHFSHDYTQNKQATQAVHKNLLPLRPGRSTVDAAVHHGPPVQHDTASARLSVAQQPQIDVIQCKGKTHANPVDSRRDLDGAALGRERLAQRVVDLVFEWVPGEGVM